MSASADNEARFLLNLGEEVSTEIAVVGGKGASLGRLIQADFPVPAGFVVTTNAYAECIRANNLKGKIQDILERLDYTDVDQLETDTARIREAVVACAFPDGLAAQLLAKYAALGDQAYVAVRSSATAEDLEGASFAGQYDTYLNIRGGDALLDAVRRCWASIWTTRVTSYRKNKGFDHNDIGIAVVVQTMVEADVAGVMFVGNPMNARSDEVVINASWGLGEAVVSGRVTPDEYVLSRDTLQVKRSTIGSKEVREVRDLKSGVGTIEKSVSAALQSQQTLTEDQASQLSELGRRVADYYGGLPQDTEWALKDGSFFLLQSRPVTGVDFTWEEDLDLWSDVPEDDDVIWTRAFADEVWSGAITPLFWTVRGTWIKGVGVGYGMGALLGDRGDWRWLKYHRGTVYYDTSVDERLAEIILPPNFRQYGVGKVHPSRIDKVMNAPFDFERLMRLHTQTMERSGGQLEADRIGGGDVLGALEPRYMLSADPDLTRLYREFRPYVKGGDLYEARRQGTSSPWPLDPDFFQARPDLLALAALSDDELFERVERIMRGLGAGSVRTDEAIENARLPYGAYVDIALSYILENWYDGDNPNAYDEVISGVPERTQQWHDDYDFWKLASTIRQSGKLLGLLKEYEGATFFRELKNHEEGRTFLAQYEEFLDTNGCRGHADRDIYYPRRIEDPMIDYRAFLLLATADTLENPEEREEKLRHRREAATAEVLLNLGMQPMGEMKVAFFKFLQDVTLKKWTFRDNERSIGDPMTWSKKVLLCELGRRTVSRGLLEADRDFYFLGFEELRGLLNGTQNQILARAKVAGRAKAFDRFLAREANVPEFMRGRVPLEDDEAQEELSEGSVLMGSGTSPGTATGRARVVPSLDEIGRLEQGDILICNATDPGWTPIFSVVSAIVGETGGMAAHFSCLSREYGMPAVSLANAMKLIEDGSIITVNGSTGVVRLASS